MGIRDSWCTSKRIATRLHKAVGPVFDPCSNPRSLIIASESCQRERGEDGLRVSWKGKIAFVNPPFSNILPFARKSCEALHSCFLVNCDVSTDWYDVLTQWPDTYEFHFIDRIPFISPPGIDESTNNSSQMFICDEWYYQKLAPCFRGMGKWFKKV